MIINHHLKNSIVNTFGIHLPFFDWYIVCGFFFKLSHNGYTVSIIYIFIALMIAVADQIIVEF